MTMSSCLSEHFVPRHGYDRYYFHRHIWHRKQVMYILYEKN